MDQAIRISPYDPNWPLAFEAEKDNLRRILAGRKPVIEHIGSTAVPGLAAKPTIDVMVGLPVVTHIVGALKVLREAEYAYFPDYERVIPERRFLTNSGRDLLPVHLHLIAVPSQFWTRRLRFRDYLRYHPERAREYCALKLELAKQFKSDRSAYSHAKTQFVERTLTCAALEDCAECQWVDRTAIELGAS